MEDPRDTSGTASKELWIVKRVLKHKVKKDNVEVKVEWNDPNKSSTWIDVNFLAIQCPTEIPKCAKEKHLMS